MGNNMMGVGGEDRGVAAMYYFGHLPHQIFFFCPTKNYFFAQLKIIFFPNGEEYRPLLSDFFSSPKI